MMADVLPSCWTELVQHPRHLPPRWSDLRKSSSIPSAASLRRHSTIRLASYIRSHLLWEQSLSRESSPLKPTHHMSWRSTRKSVPSRLSKATSEEFTSDSRPPCLERAFN